MKRLRCFSDDFDVSGSYSIVKEGLRVIRVDEIAGTVDKCNELNERFKYTRRFDKGEHYRREQIEKKTAANYFFPPIQVYKYRNVFYVHDGHRRTAAAKEQGIEFIDAFVTTCIPESDANSRLGINAKRYFEQETDIKTIRLKAELGFKELSEDLRRFGGGKMNKETALRWKTERFLPALREIEKSKLPALYPDLGTPDMYVLLFRFYNDYFDGFPRGTEFTDLISTYLAARYPGRGRPFRSFPFRFIFSLITRKGRQKMV